MFSALIIDRLGFLFLVDLYCYDAYANICLSGDSDWEPMYFCIVSVVHVSFAHVYNRDINFGKWLMGDGESGIED